MTLINSNEPDSSNIGNIPVGLYFYFISKNDTYDANYLGYAPTIESVTYNPFISRDDLDLYVNNFDVDRYGRPNNTIPKCYRIANNPTINKELLDRTNFPHRIEFPDDYEPKMYCFPYRYYLITDYINPPLLIKPELVENPNNPNRVIVKVTTSPLSQEGKFSLYVEGYKKDMIGNLEGMVNNSSLMLPVASSAYAQFLATSANSFNTNISNALLENDMSLRHGLDSSKLNRNKEIVGSVLGGVGDLLSKNVGGFIQRGVNTAFSMEEYNMTTNQMRESSGLKENIVNSTAQAKVSDMLSTPKTLKSAGNDTLFNLTNSRQKVDLIEFRPTIPYRNRIEAYFKRYGYSQNRYGLINFKTRTHFNFVKTHICNISSSVVPHRHIEQIKQIFNSGITFWHVDNGSQIGNYNQHNREVYLNV